VLEEAHVKRPPPVQPERRFMLAKAPCARTLNRRRSVQLNSHPPHSGTETVANAPVEAEMRDNGRPSARVLWRAAGATGRQEVQYGEQKRGGGGGVRATGAAIR